MTKFTLIVIFCSRRYATSAASMYQQVGSKTSPATSKTLTVNISVYANTDLLVDDNAGADDEAHNSSVSSRAGDSCRERASSSILATAPFAFSRDISNIIILRFRC